MTGMFQWQSWEKGACEQHTIYAWEFLAPYTLCVGQTEDYILAEEQNIKEMRISVL